MQENTTSETKRPRAVFKATKSNACSHLFFFSIPHSVVFVKGDFILRALDLAYHISFHNQKRFTLNNSNHKLNRMKKWIQAHIVDA